jgi:hypothetical protein
MVLATESWEWVVLVLVLVVQRKGMMVVFQCDM